MKINPFVIPGLKTPEDIAADLWNIPKYLLHIHTRKREVVECRQVLLFQIKSRNDKLPIRDRLTWAEIGNFYEVDRGTVMNACKTVKNLLETNKDFKQKFDLFLTLVNNIRLSND